MYKVDKNDIDCMALDSLQVVRGRVPLSKEDEEALLDILRDTLDVFFSQQDS